MIDWDDYRLILALGETGTLRQAANAMGLTHTTVSRRLASIEQRRGKLFEKNPRGLRPTGLGEALLAVARKMEGIAAEGARIERAAELDLSGPIKLSLPEPIAQYLLLEDLMQFARTYTEIELLVETTSRLVDLDRSEADVVVRGAQDPPDHLVGRRLYPNCVTYYADRDYLAKTPRNELRWIAPASDGLWPGWHEQSPYPDVPIGIRIDDIAARHRALAQGMGLGRGACFMADPLPNLVRLSADPPVPQQDIWILTHPDLRDTPRIKVLTEFIWEAMKNKEALVLGQLQSL